MLQRQYRFADQLGHADPALALRVYVHAMCEEETDLSFADFATKSTDEATAEDGFERLYLAPASDEADDEVANSAEKLVRREGLSVPLRRPGVPPGSESREHRYSSMTW